MSFSDEVTPAVIQSAEVEAPTPEVEAPSAEIVEASGQGETEAPAPSEPQYLDLSEYADHLVKVVVNGEEVVVKASELPNGFSRTEDYTRKTQTLAEKARFVAERERAVEEALEALRMGYQSQEPEPDPWAEVEGLDPRVAAHLRAQDEQLRQQQAFIEEQEYRQARAEVGQRVQQITSVYGDLVAADELLNEAARLQTPHLEMVAEAIAGRKLLARQQAATDVDARRTAEDQARQAAAQAAADLSSTSRNVTAASGAGPRNLSIEESLDAALAELGLSDAEVWGRR